MINVTEVVEREDGSADVSFEITDNEELRQLAGEGLNFVLIKGILGCNTEELLRWAERGKQAASED